MVRFSFYLLYYPLCSLLVPIISIRELSLHSSKGRFCGSLPDVHYTLNEIQTPHRGSWEAASSWFSSFPCCPAHALLPHRLPCSYQQSLNKSKFFPFLGPPLMFFPLLFQGYSFCVLASSQIWRDAFLAYSFNIDSIHVIL